MLRLGRFMVGTNVRKYVRQCAPFDCLIRLESLVHAGATTT